MKGLLLPLFALLPACGQVAVAEPPKPMTAVVVTQCYAIVAAVFTYPDGSTHVVDSKHHEGFDDTQTLKLYVESAGKFYVIDVKCDGTPT